MRTTTDAVSSNSNSGSNTKNNSNNQLSARNQSAPDEHQHHKAAQSSSLCARSAANTRQVALRPCVRPTTQPHLLELGRRGGHRRREVLHDHPRVVRLVGVISSERQAEARPHLHRGPVGPSPRQRVVARQGREVAVHAHRPRGVLGHPQLRQPGKVVLCPGGSK